MSTIVERALDRILPALWGQAYSHSRKTATHHARAAAFFVTLYARNRCAVLWRVQTVKKPETRQSGSQGSSRCSHEGSRCILDHRFDVVGAQCESKAGSAELPFVAIRRCADCGNDGSNLRSNPVTTADRAIAINNSVRPRECPSLHGWTKINYSQRGHETKINSCLPCTNIQPTAGRARDDMPNQVVHNHRQDRAGEAHASSRSFSRSGGTC